MFVDPVAAQVLIPDLTEDAPTLTSCNFEALEDTTILFIFLETSNLFLFGDCLSRL